MSAVPKKKRFECSENLEIIRRMPCCVCGANPPSDPHHIVSKGAGGSDDLSNLVSLCRRDHSRCHALGSYRFLRQHRDVIQDVRRKFNLPPLVLDPIKSGHS